MSSNDSSLEMVRPIVHRSSPVAWGLTLVALALGAGGAYLLQQQVDAARAEAEQARTATRDLATTLHQVEDAKRAQEAELAKLTAEDHSLAAERDSLAQSVQEKEAQLAQLQGTYRSLEERLHAEIKKGDIHLTAVNGKIRVDLVDKVLFDSGEARLSSRGQEVLARVGLVLAQLNDRQVQVSGHTDDSPISKALAATYPTNWELSSARAVNVVRFLSERANVPAQRLVAAGYGPFQPVGSNATPQGRSHNRRIEILLMPGLAPQRPPGLKAAVAGVSVAPARPAPALATRKASAPRLAVATPQKRRK